MTTLIKYIAKLFVLFTRIWDRILMYLLSSLFIKFGKRTAFYPTKSIIIGYENISIGNRSHIGPGTTIYTTNSKLIIGNKVGIGPNCILITGNHSLHLVGKLHMDYITSDKLLEDDAPIIIKDDVWIGAGSIILKGVTIERGAVIGAGSIVTKDIPPYAIAVGSPAKVQKFRWDVDTIIKHEKLVYPDEQRIPRYNLEKAQNNFTSVFKYLKILFFVTNSVMETAMFL